ncbi:MAG: PLP-dependent aminotransferase family protein [Desulfovibrio sp.]
MTIWKPKLNTDEGPLYKALADAIERDIFSGILKPSERLPTHRELADELGMNVSTVTKGYREAEKRGLVSGTVGRGTYISSDAVTSPAMLSPEPHVSGMLDLGLITPMYHLEPDISEALRKIVRRKDPLSFMRYSDPHGLEEHRKAGVLWAQMYGLKADPENIIVCAGAQHALTCCLTGLFRAGDRIATDCLTYPGLKSLASMLGILLEPVAMDDEGMTPEALDAACRRANISGLYIMPGMNNPTTVAMGPDRRAAIAALVKKHKLTVIEDDAYDLSSSLILPPIATLIPNQSIYIAGVSKALAAGLRIGFMVAPPHLRNELIIAVLSTTWMAPPLNAEIICNWITDGTAKKTIEKKRKDAAERNVIAKEVLKDFDFNAQDTGFYIWLELPEPWTGKTFETRCRELGMNVFGAEKFVVGDTVAPRAVRLSLTGPKSPEKLRQGLGLVRDILQGKIVESFVSL